MKVGDLFVSLGIKVDESKIKSIQSGFSNLRRGLIETKLAFIGAVWGLDRFISSSVNSAASIENIAKQTGLSAEALSKWDMAGQMSNLSLSAGETANSIGNLQKQLASIAMGQGNIAPFQMLGLDIVGKNAFDVIKDLRKNIEGLKPDIATNLISQLGLDPGMISILQLSNKEFEKLSNQAVLGSGSRSSILQTGFAIRNLEIKIKLLKDQIVVAIAPVINKFINQFLNWIIKNQSKIRNAISDFIEKIIYFIVIVSKGLGALLKFTEGLFGAQNGLKVLGAVIVGLLASFSPLVVILGSVSALFHDFSKWKTGKSAMFEDLYKTLTGISEKLSNFKKGIKDAFNFDEKTEKNIDKLSSAMSGLKGSLQLGLLGALIGGKVGGVQGALIGGGAGLSAGLFNILVDWQKKLLDENAIKRINGKEVSKEQFEQFKKIQNNNITLNTTINTDSNIAPQILGQRVNNELSTLQLNNGGF